MTNTTQQNTPLVFVCKTPPTDLKFGQKVKFQSKFAKQVLAKAYCEFFGTTLEQQNFRELPSGKWVCDLGYVSISHSGSFVAVAVSAQPIGLDLQRFAGEKVFDIVPKFFTPAEKLQFEQAQNKTDCFYFTWCKKEALWKSLDNQPLTVTSVDTTTAEFVVQKLLLDGEYYYLAVTGEAQVQII